MKLTDKNILIDLNISKSGGEIVRSKFLVKLVDTNGVVSNDKIFDNRDDAEIYVSRREKKQRMGTAYF